MDANGAWRIAKVAQQESVDRPTKASMLRALAKLEAYLTRIDSIIAAPKGKRSSWVGNQLERVADAAIVVQDGNSCDGDGNSDGDRDRDGDGDTDYDDESVSAQSQGNVQSCYDAARALHLCAQKGLLTHYIASSDPRAEEQAFETNMELFGPRLRPSIRRLRGGDSDAIGDANSTAEGAGGDSGSNENEMESVHGGETDLGMGMDSETPHAALDAVEAALEAALARETLAQSTNASLLAEFEAGLREALAIAPNADVLAGGNVIMHDPGHGEAAQVCIEESVRELYGDFGSDVGASQWKLEVAEVANHF